MRNRIVKQLLMCCMGISLIVGTPVVGWASETETTEEEAEDTGGSDTIEITKKNSEMTLYEDDKLSVKLSNCMYTPTASDLTISLNVENNYPNIYSYNITDAKMDGASINLQNTKGEVKAGQWSWSSIYISLEDMESTGHTDFEELSFNIIGSLNNGTEVFNNDIVIKRDAFKSLADEETSEDADIEETTDKDTTESQVQIAETDTDESKSTSDDTENKTSTDELLERIEQLEKKNEELEAKLAEQETSSDTSETDETEEVEEATATPEPTPTLEPTASPTPVPTATPEPTPEPTKAPVEYKDATTIRIVQQALNEAGYNCGNPDGIAGSGTTSAITQYQTDKGLTVNGLVTDELVQSLGVVEKVQEAVEFEQSKAEYRTDLTYDQMARNPDTYITEKIQISGKVLQAETSDDLCYARVAMNSDYDTVVFVTYDKDLLGYRLLEDDQITVYGTAFGVYSYEAVSGATITIPWLLADMIEM